METLTQLRGICPACFAQQALRSGRLVAHGYRRPQQWHSNVGTCSGAGAAHFGTEAGRDFTTSLVARLRETSTRLRFESNEVAAGRGIVERRVPLGRNIVQYQIVENPTETQRARYAVELDQRASSALHTAKEFEKKVAEWTAAEPVAVTVEAKGAPLLHLYSKRMGGKACAASMMGAQRGGYNNTQDASKVTCPKCIERIARLAAQGAAK